MLFVMFFSVFQEPLLYRCSLSCRVVRQFESVNSIQPLCTRYDVFCPQLHFSLSDMQLPMFLRLLQLSLALYYGELGMYVDAEQAAGVPLGEDQEGLLSEGSRTVITLYHCCKSYKILFFVCNCLFLYDGYSHNLFFIQNFEY